MSEPVRYETTDAGVAMITRDQPQTRNALVFMLHDMHIESGLNLKRLLEARSAARPGLARALTAGTVDWKEAR